MIRASGKTVSGSPGLRLRGFFGFGTSMVPPASRNQTASAFAVSPAARRSLFDVAPAPARVFLYRRPILDEWSERGDVSLGELVTHVLVHEIGHHFGLSDADIDAIEARDD